ncbi:MAG: AAA family ATPase [Chlorobiaceae bacterium]|nr:AAA family ATPase [Chlorobiaceae bacterium]
MNPRQHLVIIKGKDKTDQILRITRNGGRFDVTYKGGKTYGYDVRNVQWFSNPVHVAVLNSRVIANGELLSEVVEVLRFDNWAKIFQKGGGSRCCRFSDLSVQPMNSSSGRNTDLLDYFRELADSNTLRTSDDRSLMAMKYRHLNTIPASSILPGFLNARFPDKAMKALPDLIFPFGCNMSQKMAVKQAIQNPVSIVQGPPGTGKTQTILNLIANLLLLDKRVAVVSNNNSATANVLEKLQKYELDFVAAFLGSNHNKETFIQGQSAVTFALSKLEPKEVDAVLKEIRLLNNELDDAFVKKNKLAAVIQEIDALRLEMVHFVRYEEEVRGRGQDMDGRPFRPKSTARKLLKAWRACEEKAALNNTSASARPMSYFRGFLERLTLLFRFGMTGRALFGLSIGDQILRLQKAYYQRKIADLEGQRKALEDTLAGFHFDKRLEQLSSLSLQLLKHRLAGRYNNRKRERFTLDDLWRRPEEFLKEYPVILSTTFSVITSLKPGYVFDCVIVDEASQVDLLSGVLAMACATKLVIVGDPMQLPNVLTDQDQKRTREISQQYDLPSHVLFHQHNMLSAVRKAFPDMPETLLKEHYRCHPKIIQFCNQKFYGGKLLVMTCDHGEPDVLRAYTTVEGRHARGTFNQRQIDEITQTVLPELGAIDPADIGIVSPYREQATRIQSSVGSEEIAVDTVHKYQGREKRVIIITTVANESNEFVDNPNLLNVAVSRAQEKLRLVVSTEMAEGNGNIADLVRYIRYNNCEVVPGKVRSVFDLLYHDYAAVRLQALKKRKRVSRYDSENLANSEIEAVLKENDYQGLGFVFQFPLSMLVRDATILTPEEFAYAFHPWTHTDFVIYRRIDKSPVLVIEVDGYAFHREGTRQAERDVLKDSVLAKCGLPLLRLSTIGSNEQKRIRKKLEEVTA